MTPVRPLVRRTSQKMSLAVTSRLFACYAGAARAAAEEAPRGSADADGPNVRVGAKPWHKNAVYTQVTGVDPESGAFTMNELSCRLVQALLNQSGVVDERQQTGAAASASTTLADQFAEVAKGVGTIGGGTTEEEGSDEDVEAYLADDGEDLPPMARAARQQTNVDLANGRAITYSDSSVCATDVLRAYLFCVYLFRCTTSRVRVAGVLVLCTCDHSV